MTGCTWPMPDRWGLSEYVFQDYNAHLMPGQFLVTWAVTVIDPLDFRWAVALVALGSAAGVLAWACALAAVAGERVALLAPLALIALSPLFLRPTMWWASALQVVPLQICMALLVLAAAHHVRVRSARSLFLLVAALVVGLAFWQKALLAVIPAVAVLVHLTPGTLRERIRANARPIATLAAVSVAYLAVYSALTDPQGSEKNMGVTLGADRSVGQVLDFYLRGMGDLLAPALLGGPWGSMPLATDSFARPPLWLTIGCLVVVATVVGLVARRRRGAWLPLAMAGGYLVLSWGLVLMSVRFDHMQMRAINDERYHVDNFSVAVLAGVMLLASPRSARVPAAAGRRALLTGGGLLLAASLVVANLTGVHRIGVHPGKGWVDAVDRQVGAASGPVVLVDANTPDRVLSPVFFPDYARLSHVLSPYGGRVTFGGPAERLRLADDRGLLSPVQVDGQSRALPGPAEGCGFALGGASTVEVPLSEDLYFWDWVVQVNTVSGEGGSLLVEVGDTSTVVPVVPGVSQQQAQVVTNVPGTITISTPDQPGTICVSDVIIGNPAPLPG